jgi:hypothetical protein
MSCVASGRKGHSSAAQPSTAKSKNGLTAIRPRTEPARLRCLGVEATSEHPLPAARASVPPVRAVVLALGVAAAVVSFVACRSSETSSFVAPGILHRALAHGATLGVSKDVVDRGLGTSGTLQSAMMGDLRTYAYGTCGATGAPELAVTYGGGVTISMTWVPCGAVPTASQSLALARRFLPPGAVANGVRSMQGFAMPVRVYTSPGLARRVSRMWFEDCGGSDVAIGTASVGVLPTGGWSVTTGTCPITSG